MGIRIRNRKDVVAGLFYLLAGAGFAIGSLGYRMGDAARMGPAYFPFWVGVLLALVGVLTALGGMRASAQAEDVKRPDFKALAWIIGAVVLFGAALDYLGLVLALALLVVVSMRASHEFSWKAALLTTMALVAFSWVTFIWGIELQIDLWPAPLR